MKQNQINQLRHHAGLLALANSINPCNQKSGLQLWRQLRRIETAAHCATTAQCNGKAYLAQPYREEEDWDKFLEEITSKVARIFGGNVPPRFFVNPDARGNALKLRGSEGGSETATPFDLEKDQGRNQILAPNID
jgi:hypothetical protein